MNLENTGFSFQTFMETCNRDVTDQITTLNKMCLKFILLLLLIIPLGNYELRGSLSTHMKGFNITVWFKKTSV